MYFTTAKGDAIMFLCGVYVPESTRDAVKLLEMVTCYEQELLEETTNAAKQHVEGMVEEEIKVSV